MKNYFTYLPHPLEIQTLDYKLCTYRDAAIQILGPNNPFSEFIDLVLWSSDAACMRVADEAINIVLEWAGEETKSRFNKTVQEILNKEAGIEKDTL